ncbi:hypothetical protein [Emticicia agri]|uniref:DUF1579 domain-containing protein n=1 Tax=Emticicia agri TaxID=2492393 RepID=A0A4Q5M4S3_9BACT|nr:hypothetical protein [Emticicia agri]RYU96903.1 hypothetical protein EWM59_05080 [Emticicia agri]
MKNYIVFLLILFLLGVGFTPMAQPTLKPSPKLLEAMNKTYFLVGKWKGTGWIQFGPQKHNFIQTENVSLKANNTVVQIEGRGVAADDTNTVIHQAYATVSYDLYNNKYLMRAIRGDGGHVDADFTILADGAIEWKFKNPQAGEIKYTIRLVDNKWVEKGEISRDGQNWIHFFEMSLAKVK